MSFLSLILSSSVVIIWGFLIFFFSKWGSQTAQVKDSCSDHLLRTTFFNDVYHVEAFGQ